MKHEIHLQEIVDNLHGTYFKINLIFLCKLLEDASKSKKPYRNKEFVAYLGCHINKNTKTSTTMQGWILGYKPVPISKLIKIMKKSKFSWNDIEENLISIKTARKKGEINIKFPLKIEREFGSIVGYIMGDGSIDKKYKQVFFSNSNTSLLKDFKDCMKRLFNIEPRIWVQAKRNFNQKSEWLCKVKNLENVPKGNNVGLFYPKICGILLHSIFGEFANGKSKKVTKEIKSYNKIFLKYLVRAFFDSEGTTYNYRNMIRVCQDDEFILHEIKDILLNFDIKTNKVRGYPIRGKKRHVFDITNKENFLKFHELIGFTSDSKKLFPV